MKILVVDDEKWMRDMMVLWVGKLGGKNEITGLAVDGPEALEKALSLRPDLILADIMMPRMNGIDFLRNLREKGSDALVIFISGHSRFEFAQSAVNLGALGYLLKPVDYEAFSLLIKKAEDILAAPKIQAVELPAEEDYYAALLKEIKAYIASHYAEDISLESIAREFHFHPAYLSKLFNTHAKCSIVDYLTNLRMEKAKELLLDIRYSISDVAGFTGYQNAKYFGRVFKKNVGVTPSKYVITRRK